MYTNFLVSSHHLFVDHHYRDFYCGFGGHAFLFDDLVENVSHQFLRLVVASFEVFGFHPFGVSSLLILSFLEGSRSRFAILAS